MYVCMYVCPLFFYFLGPKILSLIFSHLTHSREKELELVLASSMDAVLEQAMLSGVCVPDPEDIVRISSSSNQFPSRGMYVCMYVCMCLLRRITLQEKKFLDICIVCMYVYVCIYVCIYVCLYICMYVRMQIFAGRSSVGGISEKNSRKRYLEKEFLL